MFNIIINYLLSMKRADLADANAVSAVLNIVIYTSSHSVWFWSFFIVYEKTLSLCSISNYL